MTEPRRRGRPPKTDNERLQPTSVSLPVELLNRVTRYGSLTVPRRVKKGPKRALLLRELLEMGLDTFDRAQKRRRKMTSQDR